MTAAWAAVTIAAVTIAVNVFAVVWSARNQRMIARGERVGDRQIDTYLDLLHWVKKIERLNDTSSLFEVIEAMKLTGDLEVRTVAFASSTVQLRVSGFKNAWLRVYQRVQAFGDEERLGMLRDFLAGLRSGEMGPVIARLPEYSLMEEAKAAIGNAIREELLGEVAVRSRPQEWKGLMD